MGRNTTPIVKRSRRLGLVLGKEKFARRRAYPPGVHGPKQSKMRPRLSAYGEQLREKQKAKALYGLMERQFRNTFAKASKTKGNTAEILVRLLEMRLDNAVYRLGWAKSRRHARQMVSHGFILVNDKSVDIPSFTLAVGDVIGVKESKREKPLVKMIPETMKSSTTPKWIARDDKALSGKVTATPEGEDLDQGFAPTFIVEFYSR
ncbi:30S ribosomal protein S4 [Candidatus Uhrbacteria bacterium]|nr:30S ribosomal protein S4 [Candidatus Uhrbacteria bacterium]